MFATNDNQRLPIDNTDWKGDGFKFSAVDDQRTFEVKISLHEKSD